MEDAEESVVEDGVCKVSDILRLEIKTLSSVTTSELITAVIGQIDIQNLSNFGHQSCQIYLFSATCLSNRF